MSFIPIVYHSSLYPCTIVSESMNCVPVDCNIEYDNAPVSASQGSLLSPSHPHQSQVTASIFPTSPTYSTNPAYHLPHLLSSHDALVSILDYPNHRN